MNKGEQLIEELMRFKPDGLTANGWAVRAGVSRAIWADLKRHGNPSLRTLEKLLGAAGMTLAEFEALRIGQAAPAPAGEGLADPGRGWRGAPLDPIPLFATSSAGKRDEAEMHAIDRSQAIDHLDRPTALAGDRNAYAVTMAGESMWPRFRANRRLLVSPAALIAVGDDVLVELAGEKVLIKELARRSSGMVELRQFNPDVRFAVETAEVVALHKVVGEAL